MVWAADSMIEVVILAQVARLQVRMPAVPRRRASRAIGALANRKGGKPPSLPQRCPWG